jgi:hypothetical protein
MKISLIVALLALGSASVLAQEAPLEASRVKLRADAPILFAPSGWKIEKQVNGDLNRDKKADKTLVLVQNSSPKNPDANRQRALVVLLSEGKGWKRAGFNNSLLLGTRDGGAFYGVSQTPVNVSIRNGVLVVNQDFGSREITETTHRFRFDARRNNFFLIGLDRSDRDRLTGKARFISTNYITGQRIIEEPASEGRQIRVNMRVSTRLRSLESVSGDELSSK